ncbi:MAG: imidazole glycerol phosphate synthase subunit HisH [bacterium]
MIAILDFDMGNLRSIQKGFEQVGASAVITRDQAKVHSAHKLILPGVGAFRDGMKNLAHYNLIPLIQEAVAEGKPVLGICLGMQLLFTESEEFGLTQGLNIVPGKVKRFTVNLKIPHMGWNSIEIKNQVPLFQNSSNGEYFYFVHSYYVEPENPDCIAATTEYGIPFTSAICQGTLFATQFHPEKSQSSGLKILKAFAGL